MTADVEEQIEELIGDLQHDAARVLAALDYVVAELDSMTVETDTPPSPIALLLLRGIRERLEGKAP